MYCCTVSSGILLRTAVAQGSTDNDTSDNITMVISTFSTPTIQASSLPVILAICCLNLLLLGTIGYSPPIALLYQGVL